MDGFLDELTDALDTANDAGGSLRLVDVDRRSEGNSWETFLVTAEWSAAAGGAGSGPGATRAEYAVKRQPVSGIVGDYDVEREVALLEAADRIGMRVPRAITHRAPGGGERGFFVMERVRGLVPMPHTVTSLIPDDGRRRKLGVDIATEMARLHSADPRGMGLDALGAVPDPADVGRLENDSWAQVYRGLDVVRIPVIDLALAWLDHRSDLVSGRVALVHNDFRVGNLVVEDDQIAGVLDWETAHFSDPVADIAWFAQRTSRGRSSKLCRLIELDPFLDAYEAGGGFRPDPDTLTWWAVQSLVKSAIGCLQAVDIYSRGERDELRYSNMAHSVYFSVGWLGRMLRDGEWGR